MPAKKELDVWISGQAGSNIGRWFIFGADNLNQNVLTQLQENYHHYAQTHSQPNRNIKLPSTLGIERAGDELRLQLSARSVTANMQTDAAAVEAWAFVLRLWLGKESVRRIVVDWEAPPKPHDGHYERFLYRVAQFQSLFPDWFEVADPRKLAMRRTLTEQSLILNVASGKTTSSPKTTSPEYKLESELIASEPFRRHFGLKAGLVDRQFPVGLFANTVSAKTHVFTGGKSAIDIVGLGEDGRFFIFELKVGGNISVGTLSELLLYTGLIREAAQNPPRIRFGSAKLGSRACVHPHHVQHCTGIAAVMLAENLHPLLEHPELLPALNSAAEARWNCVPGAKPVCFSKALIGDFRKTAKANA